MLSNAEYWKTHPVPTGKMDYDLNPQWIRDERRQDVAMMAQFDREHRETVERLKQENLKKEENERVAKQIVDSLVALLEQPSGTSLILDLRPQDPKPKTDAFIIFFSLFTK